MWFPLKTLFSDFCVTLFLDVDSQVQYLPVEKISVTALLFIPGFLWVGTSVGLVLLYPLPKMQGVPRVIGRACVAFHAHCGPVRSLLAVPQGEFAEETASDKMSTEGKCMDSRQVIIYRR